MTDKTDKAEQRTDWAEDRTIMANERTFNSWMGLGLGSVGVAIALKAVFGDFEPTWAAKAVASLFLLTATAIYWIAAQQAHKTHQRLTARDAEVTGSKNFQRLSTLLTLATIGTGAVLWML
jgi:putative membrane protein